MVLQMNKLDLAGKRVLIREDLNVPITDGCVTSTARIDAALPTLQQALAAGAAVMVMSHLGRPTEGQFEEKFSLAPVARCLSEKLGQEVRLVDDIAKVEVAAGEIVLLENVRFAPGEKANDEALAKRLAALCDVFVMDAFATAHRAQASTHGVALHAPVACAGPLLAGELSALEAALKKPKRPLVAIVGGSKVSTKLEVLESLAELADTIIVGGGIANTFLAAAGHNVGASLYEADLVEAAARIAQKVSVPLPSDVMIGQKFDADEPAVLRAVADVADADMIMDVGPATARAFADVLTNAGTVLWNGPLGVFEFDQFGDGTRVLGEAIAASDAFSIAGGGDTLAAIDKYNIREGISYISTGGGAFLEFVEGKTLPAVQALRDRAES